MKELFLQLLMAVFPTVSPADTVGYCPHEFIHAEHVGSGWYELTHVHQGIFYADRETYDFFTANTSSPYKKETPGDKCHTANLWKTTYSWVKFPIVTIDHERESRNPYGCWNSRF